MANGDPRLQYAALPWRRDASGQAEVLLITSRETRRWVLPKGWGKKDEVPAVSAAREAYEEAGVEGFAGETAIGAYAYAKKLKDGRFETVEVAVLALEVLREHDAWPEKDQREKLWVFAAQAAELVDEPDLKELLAAFSPDDLTST